MTARTAERSRPAAAGAHPGLASGPDRSPRAMDGPVLLAHLGDGPSLGAHRERFGALALPRIEALVALAREAQMRGRGGAGFPFAVKLEAVAKGRRPVVVVNVAEGEPASWKDTALATLVPHRVLDGALVAAQALGVHEIHVVTPSERTAVGAALRHAVDERRAAGDRMRFTFHLAAPGFVSGQARAVLELMAGRPNLPVTAWEPEAMSGHRGRPTLLSNAETYAHLAMVVRLGADGCARLGTAEEPGTTLLTIDGDGPSPLVREVAYGAPWSDVLSEAELGQDVILGGYHGTWAPAGALRALSVSRTQLAAAGLALGAGVVLPQAAGTCPVYRTAAIVDFLASRSAGRCGPCLNGLPALAAVLGTWSQRGGFAEPVARVEQLLTLVERRGACAHPDGTARLVRSLLVGLPEEVAAHQRGGCAATAGGPATVQPRSAPVPS